VALAVEFHDRYLSERRAGGIAAQAVLLCAREEVEQAYELCRMHRVFDYVMFWPVTHDPRRLPLAAHRACDAHALLAAVGGGAPATAPEAVAAPEPPRLHDGMVLVVEDDDFQLELALSVLRSANVAAAGINGGAAALAALATGTPGLILLDVDMPDVNGLELLRRLNATQPGIAVPVIMLTAVRDRSQVLEALREGAIDYIAKPYDRDTLLYKVQRVLGRPRASPRPAMY
jgi:CheY-like chemotaxis protein